jgi:hypothetical protein
MVMLKLVVVSKNRITIWFEKMKRQGQNDPVLFMSLNSLSCEILKLFRRGQLFKRTGHVKARLPLVSRTIPDVVSMKSIQSESRIVLE